MLKSWAWGPDSLSLYWEGAWKNSLGGMQLWEAAAAAEPPSRCVLQARKWGDDSDGFLAGLGHRVPAAWLHPGAGTFPGHIWGGSAGPGESGTLPPCPRDDFSVLTAPGERRSCRSPACSWLLLLSSLLPLPAAQPGIRERRGGQSSCCDLPVSRRQRRVLREPAATAPPEPVLKASQNNPRSISDSSV